MGLAARLWSWVTLGALLPTIPAFYSELINDVPPLWARALYLAAAALMGASFVHAQRQSGRHRPPLRSRLLDATLALGLLAAAFVPPSSSSDEALALRLGVAFLSLLAMIGRLQHWVTRGGLVYLLVLAFGVLLLCGVGFWLLDPRIQTLGDGLWLAFTTAATVGYGDLVPSTPASRIFSVFVVLLGLGVLTLVTAAIATSWIETEERRIEREILRDLHHRLRALHEEIAALRAENAAQRRESAAKVAQPGGFDAPR